VKCPQVGFCVHPLQKNCSARLLGRKSCEPDARAKLAPNKVRLGHRTGTSTNFQAFANQRLNANLLPHPPFHSTKKQDESNLALGNGEGPRVTIIAFPHAACLKHSHTLIPGRFAFAIGRHQHVEGYYCTGARTLF
jgi:hypothetical protein